MSNVLIGVGGSGQHVAHAYLRVLALSNSKPQDVPHIYIIDADASVQTGAKTDSQLCANIRALHRMLVNPLARENRSHFALLRPYFQTNAESAPGKAQDNLELQSCPSWLSDIFLTDETADNLGGAGDRTVDLLQGMMANAKVGATSFGFKLLRCGDASLAVKAINFGYADKETGEKPYLLDDDVRGANVAIVGSTFGGTGSGVIPALVRYLSDITERGPRLVRAFMTLPWFEIEAGEGVSAAATVGNHDPKARNAALGLRTYLSELSNGLPKANYLVAQFPGAPAKRVDKGNSNQGEDPHIFNIILATSIQQFLWSQNDTGAISGDGNGRQLLGLITARDEESDGQFDAAKSNHLRFRAGQNNNLSLLDITLEAEVLALALEKGADYIRDAAFKVAGADNRAEPSALFDLTKLIATTYDKKPLVKRGIPPFRKDVAPNNVYNGLADAIKSVAAVVRNSLVWLDAHKITNDNPQGAKFPNIGHLFNTAKGSQDYLAASEDDLKARWRGYGLAVKNKQNKDKELGDTTDRIAQAFTLFINVFFTDKQLTQELKSLQENQPDAPIYAVAARMLADLVHEEVVSARARTRDVALAEDIQDDAAPIGHTTAFFKSLKIDIEANSSRTCVIKQGSLDATVGDPGTSGYQSPTQDKHPLSVRHLDPYVGISSDHQVDLSSIARLVSHERYFSESALRGVPNVIAPLMLQDWRLARPASDAVPLLVTPGVRDLRLSETGLFQHAARIVEAGFWLLFTQNPAVELVHTDTDETLGASRFASLVNRELRVYLGKTRGAAGSNALPKTVIAFRRSKGNKAIKPILVHDPAAGWYLASNSRARKFMTEIMGSLPSVRFGSSNLDAAWRGTPTDTRPKKEEGTFEVNTAAAFVEYIDRILATQRNGDKEIGWIKALRFVSSSLRSVFPHKADGDREIDLAVTERLPFINASGAETQIALLTPKALSAISSELFVKEPVHFYVGDESKRWAWGGVWPLTGAAWEYIEPPTESAHKLECPMEVRLIREHDSDVDTRSAWSIDSITLSLRQLGKRRYDKPFDRDGTRTEIPGWWELKYWAAAVWPNFEVADWKIYYAGGGYFGAVDQKVKLDDFDLQGNELRIKDVELRYFGEFLEPKPSDKAGESAKTFGLIGTVRYLMPIKLAGRPRAVELVVNGRVLGSIPIYLKKLPQVAQTKACDLAMDFGTSNTCLAIKMDGETDPVALPLLPGEKLPFGERLPDFTRVMGMNRELGADKSYAWTRIHESSDSPAFVFQSFSTEYNGRIPKSVPSELISMRSGTVSGQSEFLQEEKGRFLDSHAIGGAKSDLVSDSGPLKQAIVAPHFTPFPPSPRGLNKESFGEFLKGGLFADFKWPSATDGAGSNIPFRAVYLEQILVAAMASLRWIGVTEIKRMVATYPGAFTDSVIKTYREHLQQILDSVAASAGVRITAEQDPLVLRSETISALRSASPNEYDVCVTIDMGGGTTDVGIVVPGMGENGDPFGYMSSVRYAGNKLLAALLAVPQLREKLGAKEDSDARRLDQLKIAIRNSESYLKQPSAEEVTRAFFEGLYEYVFGLIAAVSGSPRFPKDAKIEVRLFGNGFLLTDIFLDKTAAEFFDAIKVQISKANLLSPELLSRLSLKPTEGDAKTALIQGALKDSGTSPSDRLLQTVEKMKHGRVAIWYPCIARDGVKPSTITLGTAEERDRILKQDYGVPSLSLDTRAMEALKASFPLTNKYWAQTEAAAPIFNNAPQEWFIALGQYYLEGRVGSRSSFADVVLPKIAKSARSVNSEAMRI